MVGLIGKKIGMTSVYNENGKNIPCTVIEAGPCPVVQVKSEDKDGYNAVQLGFEEKSIKHQRDERFRRQGPWVNHVARQPSDHGQQSFIQLFQLYFNAGNNAFVNIGQQAI